LNRSLQLSFINAFICVSGTIIQKKIRARKRKKDIGKYPFVNRSISDNNKLPEGGTGTSNGKKHIFKPRVRKVKTSERKSRR